jgi:small GTP-binding protein
LQIWDTAGQERFRTITTAYYRSAMGILMVYDITKRDSFKNIQNWINQISANAVEGVKIILIGNKLDLDDCREIETSEGEELANKLQIKFLETSAKTGWFVEDAFLTLVQEIKTSIEDSTPTIKLGKTTEHKYNNKCSC